MIKWVIKTNGLYVKTGKEDTPHIHEARRFDTEEQAEKFAYKYCTQFTICSHRTVRKLSRKKYGDIKIIL